VRTLVLVAVLLGGCDDPPAGCPGPDGKHCGCEAVHCKIPCVDCCDTVPCPVDSPTVSHGH
jgi:hypothetical protein